MAVNHTSTRQYDMDWIKVLGMLAVFIYHCSMFFNPFPWHVKNNTLDTGGILAFSLFVGTWLMPIFFAVSGISVFHALKKRSSSDYIKERLIRLGVPLALGVFILTPPQVYIERITHKQFEGSFASFLPHSFDGVYLDIGGTGNFSFVGLHLWYLFVLLIFSFLTLPLFRKLNNQSSFSASHFVVLPLLLFLIGMLNTIGLGGWDIIFYLLIFVYGYYFYGIPSFKPALHRTIKLHFLMAIVTSIIYITWFMKGMPPKGSLADTIFYGVHTLSCWSWLMCIFYVGDRFLTKSNRFLQYGSEAAMPFYVIHQPVIVFIGFMIRDLSWPIPVKVLFLVIVSFAIIMASYHFVIRHVNVLRFLFGIKDKKTVKGVIITPPVVAE